MTHRSRRAGDRAIGTALAAFFVLALVLAGGPAAKAQDNTEHEVRAMLEQMYRGMLFGATSGGFQLVEPFRVERADGGASSRFEVILPGVKFIAADGTRLELGDVNLNVTVLGEGRFEMSGELPAEIVFHESEGVTAGRASIREHRFEGVWNAAIFQFETLDWQSGAWQAFNSGGVEVLTVSSASLTAKLEPTSQTHGDGVAVFELKDMSISVDGDLLHIDRIEVNAAARNSDLVGYGKLLGDLAEDSVDDPAGPNTAAALNDLILSNVRILGDVDYLMSIGTDILAVAPGTVAFISETCPNNTSRCDPGTKDPTCRCFLGLGNVVVVRHTESEYSMYAHLDQGSIRVTLGQEVCTGLLLAGSGWSGFGTGPHLHFQFQDQSLVL